MHMIPKTYSRSWMRYTGETQPLESPQTHSYLLPDPITVTGLSYDQQSYQWFTGKLNCLMENLPIQFCWWKQWGYSFNCEMVVEWQICVQPRLHFSHPDGCEKVKRAHYWKTEPLCKFEFGGGETVIKTAEAKTRSWYPSMDQGIWPLVRPSSTKLSEKLHNTPKTMVQCGCR